MSSPTVMKPEKEWKKSAEDLFPAVEINVRDFFDLSKPWLLVESGSYMGHFDNVPKAFRVGPWNIACCIYLFAVIYYILFECVTCYANPPKVSPTEYDNTFGPNTWQWWYNATGFCWTLYIAYRVTKTSMGWSTWIAYTLQSWTIIIVRHGLSTLAPFSPMLARLNEHLRFPMLLQTTIVFVLWNFAILPAIAIVMKPKARKEFLNFCFSFLLMQLHFVNLPLAVVNGIWGSPVRDLNKIDLCVGLALALQYIVFYLFFLDRIGVHLYFIFSPRSPLAFLSWTAFLATHFVGFALWKSALTKYGVAE